MSLATASERRAAGRAVRSTVPRSALGVSTPGGSRPDPVTTLRATESDRLSELLPLRYERMAASPFGFLRGAASIMATDLAATPRSGLRVQACGDAHIGNFRLLGTPERKLNFDLNDFDETHPAPFEWDVKRLAASAVVAARHNGKPARACREIAQGAARAYRVHMAEYAQSRTLDVWYAHIDSTALEEVLHSAELADEQRRRARKRLRKAREKDNLRALRRLTTMVDGVPRLREDPPVLYRSEQDAALVERAVRAYRTSLPPHIRVLFDRYTLVDYAVRVVGVGSVGTRCWVVLFDGSGAEDALVLQLKQAGQSVLEPHTQPSAHSHHGQRVVHGQRLIQAAGDIFLGWTRSSIEGVDYYVRQLWDMKGRFDTERMDERSLALFAELSGWALARAHARSGDPAAIHGYLGSGTAFDRAITAFAVGYADQTERDHQRLCDAIDVGELPAAAAA